MKNKRNLIFISLGAIILLIITFVSYKYYQRNINIKINDFSSYINEYKQELSNYYLINNQGDYDNLIKESELVINNRDYKKISYLTSSLNEFKDKILSENNNSIVNFSNYINTYEEEIINYNLGENKETYDSLIAKCKQAITNKDYKKLDTLTSNLNQFKEEILNKNVEWTNNVIAELEKIDISKISDKESINGKIEEIKKLKDEKRFVEATEMSKEVRENINNQLEIIKQEEERIKENSSKNKLLSPKDVIEVIRDLIGRDGEGEYWDFAECSDDEDAPYKISYVRYKPTGDIYYYAYMTTRNPSNDNIRFMDFLVNAKTNQVDDFMNESTFFYQENLEDFELLN